LARAPGLVAIMDRATRKVLRWRLGITMHAGFRVEALKEAITKHGPPEIATADSHAIGASSTGGLMPTPIDHPSGWCGLAFRRDLSLTPIDPARVFHWTCRSSGNALW